LKLGFREVTTASFTPESKPEAEGGAHAHTEGLLCVRGCFFGPIKWDYPASILNID